MNKDELIQKIINNRLVDIDLQVELCDKLYKMANDESNMNLMGVALFYKGETVFSESQDEAKTILKNSLGYLELEESSELVARTNNILGIIASSKRIILAYR